MASPTAGESKTNIGGKQSVYSATSFSPAMLANPLTVRATVLRRPEFFEAASPELVEEGDVLFDVLSNPLHHPSANCMTNDAQTKVRRRSKAAELSVHGIGSVLSLPTSLGKFFVGQPFRAFLSFHNAANYPLATMAFSIVCLHPKLHRSKIVNYECSHLEGKGNASFTVEFLLKEPGQYTLDVLVTYMDIAKEAKRLTWSFSIQVERAIIEVSRTIHLVPIITRHGKDTHAQLRAAGPTLEEAMSNITLPTKKYVLSVCLQNVSSVPLFIVSVKLHAEGVFQLLPRPRRPSTKRESLLPPWWPADVAKPRQDEREFGTRYTGGGADTLESVYLRPKDKHCYYFELVLKPDILCSLPLQHTASGAPAAVVPSNFTDVGYVEWKWCRANGDSGAEHSSRVRVNHLFMQPMLDFFVLNVDPETPTAGKPTKFDCAVVNYDSDKQFDLALRVRPDLLAPSFLYAGPLLIPLGLIEPRGTVNFPVSLLPWQPGWVVLQGGLELCDARAPATLLWPLQPGKTQPLPPNSSTILSSAVTDTPEQPYPPVLCELLVR
ncbi:uncharacterized protein TcG_03734 [Trypanosoma cruzi]|nr:uncharacterized protein TcG_03734 [Trypanosoma cruzi]